MRAARHGSGGVLGWSIAGVLFGAAAAGANAQCPGWLPTNDEGLPGPNGTVNASVAWDPDGDGPEPEWLVVGGRFDYVGLEHANNIAAWDGDEWRTFSGGTNGSVLTLAVHGGQLFAGGAFTTAGGVLANRVARWDGVQWQALGTGVTGGEVRAMVSDPAGLYIAGAFTRVEGQASAPVARWDGSAWNPFTAIIGAPRNLRAIVVYNSEIYVGGRFSIFGSAGVFGDIAKWDGTQWNPVGAGLRGEVAALAIHNGELFAGARFEFTDGSSGALLGAVASWDGSAWSPVGSNPFALRGVSDFESLDGVLYAASGVARLVDGVWESLSSAAVSTISRFRSSYAVAGSFRSIEGSTAASVAIRDADSWDTLGYPVSNEFDGPILTLLETQAQLIAGGAFASVNGQPATGLARWDGAMWSPFAAPLKSYLPARVSALTEYQGELIVAGAFGASVDSGIANNIARWDGEHWRRMADGLGTQTSGSVSAMAVYQGDLYAVGEFLSSGDLGVSRIARWNGSEWSRVARPGSQGTGLTSSVNALTVAHGSLYVGGFGMSLAPAGLIGPGSVPIYRWDGTSYDYVPTIPDSDFGSNILSLCTFNGDVIAGGSFTSIQGVPANSVARWDGATWSPLGTGVGGTIHTLAVFDGSLVAAGYFGTAGGVIARNVARWDGTAWHPLGAGTNGTLFALAPHRGELFVGGTFSGAGGMNSVSFARWSDTGIPPIVNQPADTTADVSGSAMLGVSLSPGYELGGALRYQWRRNAIEVADGSGGASPGGGDVSGATSSVLAISNVQPGDAGVYDCLITNDCGEVVSATATLTVLNGACPWDVNLDGAVGLLDLGAVLGAWGLMSPPASGALDLDDSGVIDLGDVSALIAHWGAACP